MLHDSYFTLSFIARKARALRNGEYLKSLLSLTVSLRKCFHRKKLPSS